MKILRCSLQYLTFVSLLLLIGSGIYDMVVGIRASNCYMWNVEHYAPLSPSSIVLNYALGVFRGAVTLLCGAAGLWQAAKGRVRLWYLLLLGWLTAQYVLAVVHEAYKSSPVWDWVQLWIATGCFAMVALYTCLHREKAGQR